MRLGAAVAVLASLALASCQTVEPKAGAGPRLVGTEWRLISFVSSDDSIGTIRPGANENYTLRLDPDGQVAMQLFCNRGTGRWSSTDTHTDMGSVAIDLKAATRAACPPSPLERIAADMPRVRSFVIRDGRLHLNLMMDSGDYVWEPVS